MPDSDCGDLCGVIHGLRVYASYVCWRFGSYAGTNPGARVLYPQTVTDADRFPKLVREACHDVRTPLATAYGFARTLERIGGLDEQQQRYLRFIVASCEEQTRLIDAVADACASRGRDAGGEARPGRPRGGSRRMPR